MARFFLERGDPGADLRRYADWLDETALTGGAPPEWRPAVGVFETATTVEVFVDLPGVPADGIRISCSAGVLVITGQKLPQACEHAEAAFHLAERCFGRFARAVRVAGAFDAGRARATLTAGELHVVLPRIEDRRGRQIEIRVEAS